MADLTFDLALRAIVSQSEEERVDRLVKKCENCEFAIQRSKADIARYGNPHKYLECTATDKTINIYKSKEDVCDKGKFKERI